MIHLLHIYFMSYSAFGASSAATSAFAVSSTATSTLGAYYSFLSGEYEQPS